MLQLRHLFRRQPRPFRLHTNHLHTGPRQQAPLTPIVRHVRFRRPWLRSFFFKCLLYGVAYQLWSSFVLVRLDDDTHNTDVSLEPTSETTGLRQSSPDNEELLEGEGEIEVPLFVPLTWSWLEEGELYAASDPEWQEFVKISKDRAKLQKLRNELAAIVLENASGQLSQVLGGPLSLTGFWLVHQFPHRAPPEYMRSGIEFADDSVSWVTRSIDPEVGDRLQMFMKPVHVALAIKDAYLVLFKRKLARFQGQSSEPLDLLNNNRVLSSEDDLGPVVNQHGQPTPPQKPDESSANRPLNGSLHPSLVISLLQRLPLPDIGPGSDLHLAAIAFRLRLNEYLSQTQQTPLRGAFFISGPVGLKGPKGFCRLEVRGEYDPAKPGWRTVRMTLRDINFRKQRPLRE
ncbi:hypothetical protein N7456_011755 [Penicillium angulare]|uniref:Uncharacterized protein n=1 Tax=Penicillium angulare TaxID=116970 RepID=A0A9W9K002_9EURO|nr:hypothetical protein N7456_011755 [Penicillium angulare]